MGIKEILRSVFQEKTQPIVVDQEWLGEIAWAIETHEGSARVDYGEQQFIEVVGESYHDENIRTLVSGGPGEAAGWIAGYLLPEPKNTYDKNAVAIYAIHRADGLWQGLHVGYMPAPIAKVKQREIKSILDFQGKIIPLLIIVKGGVEEFPQYGIVAYAKTDQIVF